MGGVVLHLPLATRNSTLDTVKKSQVLRARAGETVVQSRSAYMDLIQMPGEIRLQ